MKLKMLAARLRLAVSSCLWHKGSVVQNSYKVVAAGLICLTIAHVSYLLSIYFANKIRINRNVKFYNEKKPLKFPDFLVCFSKVFTYSRLSHNDIDWLYSSTKAMSNKTSSEKYAWQIPLEDVITGVVFKRKLWSADVFFQPLFVSAKETCWITKKSNFTSGQSGRLYTIDLIINAAVFDDVLVEYKSPLTHVKIVPHYGDGKSVPSMRSTIYVSPGTLTTAGFELYKIDSTIRNKNDTKCNQLAASRDDCVSLTEKRMIRDTCKMHDDQNRSVSNFFKCALMITMNNSYCQLEPCKLNLFRFTKSESYVKFDNRLSNLRIHQAVLKKIKKRLVLARSLHSKFNPDVKRSFGSLAGNMNVLTTKIAKLLVQKQGHECSSLDKSKLIRLEKRKLPDTMAELARITTMRNKYVVSSRKTFRTLFQRSMDFAHRSDIPIVAQLTPVFYWTETKNAIFPSTQFFVNKYYNFHEAIGSFSRFGNNVITSFRDLQRQTSQLHATYSSLAFTNFTSKYGVSGLPAEYNCRLKEAKLSVKKIHAQLFHGVNRPLQKFAFDDRPVQSIFGRNPLSGMNWPSAYANNIWIRYPWQIAKNRHNLRHSGTLVNPPFMEVVYGRPAHPVIVPVLAELYCFAYDHLFRASEALYGTVPSFSILLSGAKFSPLFDHIVFVLGELFSTHETSVLFDIELDGIVGAERRACARMMGYPIYAPANASKSTVDRLITRTLFRVLGLKYFKPLETVKTNSELPVAVRILVRMYTDYSWSFARLLRKTKLFNDYYRKKVVPTVGSMFNKVANIRAELKSYRNMRFVANTHKTPLSKRLRRVAHMIRSVIAGDGEEAISKHLSKTGKILLDEIRNQIGEAIQHLSQVESTYSKSIQMTNMDGVLKYTNNSFQYTLFRAVLTAFFDPNPSRQLALIEQLSLCILETRGKSVDDGQLIISLMSDWVVNMSLLVTRAKRYVKSTEISRSFLRENMMTVSLFFDSMSVFTYTSEHAFKTSELYPRIGTITDAYIGVTVFDLLAFLTYLMTSFFVYLGIQRR